MIIEHVYNKLLSSGYKVITEHVYNKLLSSGYKVITEHVYNKLLSSGLYIPLFIQRNLFKLNLLGTKLYVWNKQVFGLYRLNLQRLSTLGLYLNFSLYRIAVYPGFSLDRFHCIPVHKQPDFQNKQKTYQKLLLGCIYLTTELTILL